MRKLKVLSITGSVVLTIFMSCQPENEVTPEIQIKTAVKLAIGGIVYENLDANIRVTGFNKENTNVWTEDYEYTGPSDTLIVQFGFDHYSIELINKWGVNDIQSNIPADELWNGRIGSDNSVTYVLGGSINAKRLTSTITSLENNLPGGGIGYELTSRDLYDYTPEGQLQYIHHEFYDQNNAQYVRLNTETFLYQGSTLLKIQNKMIENDQLYSEDVFQYGADNKLIRTNYFDNGHQWIRTSFTDNDSSKVKTNYAYSTGSSFEYTFDLRYKNPVSEKTIQGGTTCNEGNYTYDKNINPLRHLGYIDFNFANVSINNKLTENVNYLACSFPSFIPGSYSYVYDSDGYPISQITTFLTDPSTGHSTSPYHRKVEFIYGN